MDTQAAAAAEAASRSWYVPAYRGRDAINMQAFAKLAPGRRLTSRSWKGFRLFEEPAYMVNFGYAHQYLPWEVWEVRPTRVLGFEPMLQHEARQIRARHIEVVQLMPDGFEFGPNGHAVRLLVEQLAQCTQPGGAPGPDYVAAMTFLQDQLATTTSWLHDSRVSLARAYLDFLASGKTTGPIGRWDSHLAPRLPAYPLIDAAVSGLTIPQPIASHWGIAPDSRTPS
ncbi:hypothetical protein MMAD_55890 (plasmid) [Mycolicibacterium madagascariense]|uniref:Uncharacterized protein n=1 Tax=Mycolicibacterium madagascariense TaxID=212765 RepID=A0A7I7XQ78_9MYCO|nr:hypothetical protein [Mycolicibacterium madagascariense]BBZ31294.1 hypothetical protein MMAD_55890 [Mycolicibacterium madagascariense]